jgi:hypothetical protein
LELAGNPEMRKGAKVRLWLLNYLKNGKLHRQEDVVKAAESMGFDYMPLYRAYNQLEGHKEPVKSKETGWKSMWQLHGEEKTTWASPDDIPF